MGYHRQKINKGILGDFSKIQEEWDELQDARQQLNPVMELIEFSDLLGAIDSYAKKRFNISINCLLKMTDATRSAFNDGERK